MDSKGFGRKEIRIVGVGGQGVVLSGHILGKAAAIFGHGFAAMTQSYGPEARGGSCAADVVISSEPIAYPYVTSPQVIILLTQEAYSKFAYNLPHSTLVIIDPDAVTPDLKQNPKPLFIPATRLAREMGRVVVANIIMLGFLCAVSDIVSSEVLRKSVLSTVPKGTEEFNLKAFELGYRYGQEQGGRGDDAPS